MTSFDLISMAARNLWKRKLRTFLTVLGVIIGTASIIVMVSLGIGMNESFEAQLSQRGNLRVITVNAPGGGRYGRGGMMVMDASSSSQNHKVSLDEKAIASFKKIKGVEAVTPMVRGYFRFLVDKYVGDISVTGVDPSNMEAFGYNLDQGRLLTDGDELTAVFGSHATEYNFYNPKMNWRVRWNNPAEIGNIMDVKKVQMTYDNQYGEKRDTISTDTETKNKKPAKVYKLNVVGLLGGDSDNSYSVFMPISQVQKLIREQEKFEKEQYKQYGGSTSNSQSQSGYNSIMVKCYNMDDVKTIQEQIKEMGFQTYSLTEDLEYQKETSKSMQALLGAIGAVSLLVAAIGITNTMVMSIYERTREIGVMKVIGASLKDIKRLFLVEAALIGFLGGIFGVGVSILISNIINSTGVQFLGMMSSGGGKISSIPMWLSALGLGFSALVGIISGYFPARRAMNLSAISAIHTE